MSHIYLISSTVTSLASTTLSNPTLSKYLTSSNECATIWVLACNSKSGNSLFISLAIPISWSIIASTSISYKNFAYSKKSSISFSFLNVFVVTKTCTPLIWAYFTASFNSSLSKLFADALAPKSFPPRYTAFAPFCTAAFNASKDPTGANNSTSLILSSFKAYLYYLYNIP